MKEEKEALPQEGSEYMQKQKEPYFIFKGKKSTDMGLLLSSLPAVTKPKRKTNKISIPGRNGTETEDLGIYEGYTISIGCGFENIHEVDIDRLWRWLDGKGNLILSTEPSKQYNARLDGSISMTDVYWITADFLLQFDVEPFKYAVNPQNDFVEMTKKEMTLYNRGTYIAEPVITLYGSGTVSIAINGTEYSCSGVSGFVTIDSTSSMVYKEGENKNSNYQSRAFPILDMGENKISISSGVTKAEIIPNWRWI